MIRSFGDRRTEELFHGVGSRRVGRLEDGLRRATIRKLDMLNAAEDLRDMRSPPGNRLEQLPRARLGRPLLPALLDGTALRWGAEEYLGA